MTMYANRQQRRKSEREFRKVKDKLNNFDKTLDLAEAVRQHAYSDGWKAACDFCMKVCYASSVKALHDLEGYGTKRNTRFLRKMDWYVTNAMTSDEAIEEAFAKGGVAINFREPFEEDRVQEAGKK